MSTHTDGTPTIILGVFNVAAGFIVAVFWKVRDVTMPEGGALEKVLYGCMCLLGSGIVVIFSLGLAVFFRGLNLLSEYSDLSEPCGGTADYEKLSQLKPLLLVSTTTAGVGVLLCVLGAIALFYEEILEDCDNESRVENRVQDRVPATATVVDEAVAEELKQQVKELQQQMKQLQQQVRQLQLQPQPTQPDLLPRGVGAACLAEP
eukprot:COSAG02_NODE_536_length_20657_cov_91.744041_17_plen_205_part_00